MTQARAFAVTARTTTSLSVLFLLLRIKKFPTTALFLLRFALVVVDLVIWLTSAMQRPTLMAIKSTKGLLTEAMIVITMGNDGASVNRNLLLPLPRRRLRFRPQPTQFATGVVALVIGRSNAMREDISMDIKSKELMGGAVAAEVAELEAAEEGKMAAVVVVAVAVAVNLAIPITAL